MVFIKAHSQIKIFAILDETDLTVKRPLGLVIDQSIKKSIFVI
jgi:hypothetical protein